MRRETYDAALKLLKDINEDLKDDELKPTVIGHMAHVVEDLNKVMIKDITGMVQETEEK